MITGDILADSTRIVQNPRGERKMPLVTVREAAVRLRVGYSTLKQWIYQGRVRTTRTPGGHHRIAESELDRLLAREGQPAVRRRPGARRGVIVSLSGRNQLRGFIDEVRVEGLL